MDTTMLTLKWERFDQSYLKYLSSIRQTQEFSDATIACDGKFYNVHKLVMSSCSDYLRTLFENVNVCSSPITHPVIILAGVPSHYMETLLDYMYLGKIDVVHSDLVPLIKAAAVLQIKGFEVPDKPDVSDCNENKRNIEDTNLPYNKRSRHDILGAKELENISNRYEVKDLEESSKHEIKSFNRKVEKRTEQKMTPQSKSTAMDERMSVNYPDYFSMKQELPSNQMKKFSDTIEITESANENLSLDSHSQISEIENSCNSKYEQGNKCDHTEELNCSIVDYKTQYDENKNQTPPKPDGNKTTISPGGPIEAIDLWLQLKTNKDLAEGVSCPLCTKHCKNKGAFLIHYKTHTSDKPFACPHCSSRFVQRASLRNHIKTHTVGRPFACPICHRRFIQQKNLKKHVITHAKELQNMSNRLEVKDLQESSKHKIKSFNIKAEKQTEEKMDQSKSTCMDERMYVNYPDAFSIKQELPSNQMKKCSDTIEITESVNENLSLDSHSQISELENSCKSKYEQVNDSETEKPNCSNVDFKTQNDENKDNKTPKPDDNKSTISPGGPIEAIDLWLQLKTNKEHVNCPLCTKQCTNKGAFLNHYKTHTGDKPFAFPHCPSHFVQRASMRNHIKTHTVERPFACPFCHRRFLQQQNLENHVIAHAGKN